MSQTINAILSGTTVTQVRDDIYLIDIVARAIPEERAKLETLRSLMINVPGGRSVPLEQVAKLSYGIEPPLVWRRHRLPTITVQADTAPGLEAATVVKALSSEIAAFKSKLPAGYDVVAGGTVEESAKAEASIFAVFPLMILIMITILMVQLQSFQRLFLVLATAPLALIGVAAALLISRAPMGFVAILGVVSLIGMVIRNSVILIDQIDTEIAAGQHPWNAVIVATEHRLRPILLTAAAAILGMIPIAPTVFWGPMAYAVMGGLVVATLLTLVFLPALYVAWFRIKPISETAANNFNRSSCACPRLINEKRWADVLKLQLHVVRASKVADFEAAFKELTELRTQALLISADLFLHSQREKLVALAAMYALPTIYPWREYVADGGLISYGPSLTEASRLIGIYTGKILEVPIQLGVLSSNTAASGTTKRCVDWAFVSGVSPVSPNLKLIDKIQSGIGTGGISRHQAFSARGCGAISIPGRRQCPMQLACTLRCWPSSMLCWH